MEVNLEKRIDYRRLPVFVYYFAPFIVYIYIAIIAVCSPATVGLGDTRNPVAAECQTKAVTLINNILSDGLLLRGDKKSECPRRCAKARHTRGDKR